MPDSRRLALTGLLVTKPKSAYWYYSTYERTLHIALGLLVLAATVLEFTANDPNALAIVGIGLLAGSVCLLLVVIIGSDIWFPRTPHDVFREAKKDEMFETHVASMDEKMKALAQVGATAEHTDRVMRPLVSEAVSLYRHRYASQLARRGARRLAVLMALVLTFGTSARVALLISPTSYGGHLTRASSVIDCIYFAFIAVSTIGYGDIAPVSIGARVLSIGFGLMTILYLLVIVNYVWMHEARRETLLVELLDEQYLDGYG